MFTHYCGWNNTDAISLVQNFNCLENGLLWRNCCSRLPILIILRKLCLVLPSHIFCYKLHWCFNTTVTNEMCFNPLFSCFASITSSCRRNLWTDDSSSTKLYVSAEISGTCTKLWQCCYNAMWVLKYHVVCNTKSYVCNKEILNKPQACWDVGGLYLKLPIIMWT